MGKEERGMGKEENKKGGRRKGVGPVGLKNRKWFMAPIQP